MIRSGSTVPSSETMSGASPKISSPFRGCELTQVPVEWAVLSRWGPHWLQSSEQVQLHSLSPPPPVLRQKAATWWLPHNRTGLRGGARWHQQHPDPGTSHKDRTWMQLDFYIAGTIYSTKILEHGLLTFVYYLFTEHLLHIFFYL